MYWIEHINDFHNRRLTSNWNYSIQTLWSQR